MKLVGYWDTDGNYNHYTSPIDVAEFGDTLRDKSDGSVWAIKDDYGDWVSPRMHRLGIKVKQKVEPETTNESRYML